MITPKYIFGLGTGRCGTWSLHRLLAAQPSMQAWHESGSLTWEPDPALLWRLLERHRGMAPAGIRFVSNVSFFFLPYVSEIMSHFTAPRMICMERDREEVVESFMAHMPHINHWTAHDSIHWNPRDKPLNSSIMFPSYDLPKREAIGAYWDDYHAAAEYWAAKFPECFRVYNVDALNHHQSVKEILDFIGIPEAEQKVFVGVKLNTLHHPKGEIEGDYVYRANTDTGSGFYEKVEGAR